MTSLQVFLAAIIVCSTYLWPLLDAYFFMDKLKGKADDFIMDLDPHVTIRTTSSILDCVSKCLRRKQCKFFRYARPLMRVTYKCSMDLNPGQGSDYKPVRTCYTTAGFIKIYPTALAGACADHRCEEKELCQPLQSGGYNCTLDVVKTGKGRRRRRRHKHNNRPSSKTVMK